MTRVLACLLMFGLTAEVLGGGAIGVIGGGLLALVINRAWRQQEARDHQRAIEADEETRLRVRELRGRP